MNERVYQTLKLSHPSLLGQVVECIDKGGYEVILKLQDGKKMSLDVIDNSIRILPASSENISDWDLRKEFSIRLQKIMRYKGITQAMLADMADVSRVQIYKYVHGQMFPSFYNLDKIAKALNCSMDEFRYLD